MPTINADKWFDVDQSLRSARRRLQTSENETDFQAVGILCRETIVSIGQLVLDEKLSSLLPNVSDSDANTILSKYFEIECPRRSNEEFRSYAKSCLKLANSLQHDQIATYTQAELCIEACAHLIVIIRILSFKEVSAPNKRFRPKVFASAESEFITTCIMNSFNIHPVAKSLGLICRSLVYQGSEITLQATKKDKVYTVTLQNPYWWRGANRVSADLLLDEFLVLLITEFEKESFAESGQPPA